MQSTLPVIVSYRTPHWIKVALQTYRRVFPADAILVVDNNPKLGAPNWEPLLEEERAWIKRFPGAILLENTGYHGHGVGLDLALSYCRERGYKRMLCFEPDCYIESAGWREQLEQALDEGAWMAGSKWGIERGPAHPCPSLWDVAGPWEQFSDCDLAKDKPHPKFNEVYRHDEFIADLEARQVNPKEIAWWRNNWDMGQRNWFLAAIEGKARTFEHMPGFRHYWNGAVREQIPPPMPIDIRLKEDPELRALVENRDAGVHFASPASELGHAVIDLRKFHLPEAAQESPHLPARQGEPTAEPEPWHGEGPEILVTIVAWNTADWIKIALRSLHEFFPHAEVLVVDNNPERGQACWTPRAEEERRWLQNYPQVHLLKNERDDKSHGIGMQLAYEEAKRRHARIMVHFDADCRVAGHVWLHQLKAAIDEGAWLAGGTLTGTKLLHVTPSAWLVGAPWKSFEGGPKAEDLQHPRHAELFDDRPHVETIPPEHLPWFLYNWDTGQRNWFLAACRDKAKHVETPDLVHYWGGSHAQGARVADRLAADPALQRYLY